MSGGTFGYLSHGILETAEAVKRYLTAVALTEEKIDWALAGDSSEEDAKQDIFDLWKEVFSSV